MTEKIIYQIAPSIYNCDVEVWVNNIKTEVNYSGFPLTFAFPINQWLINGANTISIDLSPISGNSILNSDSIANVSIVESPFGGDHNYFLNKNFNPNQNNDQKDKSNFSLKFSFLNKNKFEKVTWFEEALTIGKDIEIQEAAKIAMELSKSLHNLFENKNTAQILEATDFRTKEVTSNLFTEYQKYKKIQEEDLNKMFSNIDYVIQEFNIAKYTPKIYGLGKLFTFENNVGRHPVMYRNEIKKSTLQYPMYFCFLKNKEILLVR